MEGAGGGRCGAAEVKVTAVAVVSGWPRDKGRSTVDCGGIGGAADEVAVDHGGVNGGPQWLRRGFGGAHGARGQRYEGHRQ